MKKIIIGTLAFLTVSVVASAAISESSIPGIEVTENLDCENGYVISSTRDGAKKYVMYDSCLSEGIVVKDVIETPTEEEPEPVSLAQTVNIKGVDYYFPYGYTADIGDYVIESERIWNYGSATLSSISQYRNLISVGTLGLTTINYSSGMNSIVLRQNPLLQDISPLNNIQYVGNIVNFDNREYTVKMAADSYLCQHPEKLTILSGGGYVVMDKSKVCESE